MTYLLDTGDVAGDVFNGDRVLHGEAMALALYPGLVNQHAAVRSQTFVIQISSTSLAPRRERTGEGKADVIVQHHGLANRTGILQLQDRLLLHAEDDNVLAPHSHLNNHSEYAASKERVAHRTSTLPDGLVCILDLE
jgi:hypothetical protein